jgi:hypothetical protein
METDNFKRDDFLGDLIKKSSSENPSEIFVERVMEKIQQEPGFSVPKNSFFRYLLSVLPAVLILSIILLFLFTSDFPFYNYFSGKDYFTMTLMPYLNSLWESFKVFFGLKSFSFALMVILAAGFLVFIEAVFSRKAKDFFLSKVL